MFKFQEYQIFLYDKMNNEIHLTDFYYYLHFGAMSRSKKSFMSFFNKN
jgi:hypothetical protein